MVVCECVSMHACMDVWLFALKYKLKSAVRIGRKIKTQSVITCSKLIIETLEDGVKYVQG